MAVEEQLRSGKIVVVFRFAGAFVGSAVVTGKEITGFGVGCGEKALNLCEASIEAVGGICGRAVQTKRRIVGGPAERAPCTAPVQTAVAVPIAIEAEEPSQPQAPDVIAPIEMKTEHAEPAPEAPTAVQGKADAEAIEAKGLQPQVSYAPKTTYRDVTSEEVEAAKFIGAAQKVLLTKALSDLAHEDVITRAHAAEAIGGIRHELSIWALAAHFFREDAVQVRKECINALGTIGMKEGLPVVEDALNDSSVSVRLAAVRGVYRLAGVESASALVRMLADENVEVRRMVTTCIGWLDKEHLAAELIPLLTDKSVSVRQAAVKAVGNLRSPRVVFTLIECLNDSDESVRKKVLDVLEGITGKKMSEGYPEDEEGRQRLMARWRHWWKEESQH